MPSLLSLLTLPTFFLKKMKILEAVALRNKHSRANCITRFMTYSQQIPCFPFALQLANVQVERSLQRQSAIASYNGRAFYARCLKISYLASQEASAQLLHQLDSTNPFVSYRRKCQWVFSFTNHLALIFRASPILQNKVALSKISIFFFFL